MLLALCSTPGISSERPFISFPTGSGGLASSPTVANSDALRGAPWGPRGSWGRRSGGGRGRGRARLLPEQGGPCARRRLAPPVRAPARLIRRAVCLQTRASGRCAPPRTGAAGVRGQARRASGCPGASVGEPWPRSRLLHASGRPRKFARRRTSLASEGGRERGPRGLAGGGRKGLRVAAEPRPARPPGRARSRPGRRGGRRAGARGAGRGAGGAGTCSPRAPRPPLGGPGAGPDADYYSRQAPRRSA